MKKCFLWFLIVLALASVAATRTTGTLFGNYPRKTSSLHTNDLFLISDGSTSTRATKTMPWVTVRGSLPANTATAAGIVSAGEADSVWQSDASGNPDWRNAFTVPWSSLTVSDTNATVNLTGTVFRHTLTNNLHFSQITNMPAWSKTFYVWLTQDTNGAWSVSFDTNYFKWPSGTAPTITTNASAVDLVTLTVNPTTNALMGVATHNFQ